MKKTLVLALALALLLSLAAPAFGFGLAVRSAQKLSVNGKTVDCDKYNIDGSNYFKLRDLAALLDGTGSQFDVGWDAAQGVVSITTKHAYTEPNGHELELGADQSGTTVPSAQTIMIDGVVRKDLTVYNIGGSNFFKLRELGDALGFDVDYVEATNTATVASREAAAAGEIKVTDLCAYAGRHLCGSYYEYYSYRLPKVSGPDTAYLREINAKAQEIYDRQVKPALEAMEGTDSLYCFCVSYKYAVNGGIHSLLITCDSDWGETYYWCFNFDSAGNKVENADVLKAAGLTEARFVEAARAYLAERTDLSEYFLDDGWKDYQTRTISDENCNAAMPMVLLPGGNLCFIATIYSVAGAEQYDYALEFAGQGIRDADVGQMLIDKLFGTYLVETEGLGDAGFSYLLDFFTINDSLTVEVTAFDSEEKAVYYYFASDILPEREADLFRGDVSSMKAGLLSYCPDVAAGMNYYGEAGRYTLTCDGWTVSFTDFAGGTPLLGDGQDFTARRVYRDDIGIPSYVPDTDYDNFDYDTTEATGLPGIWTGSYLDPEGKTHTLDLELTSWGELSLRDSAEGAIPWVFMGSYYIAGQDDASASAGAVVFNLVSRAGYKMPGFGWCTMTVGADGRLKLTESTESWDHLTQLGESDYCFLSRVPAVRPVG